MTMYWEERTKEETVSGSDDVVDLVYPIACQYLPVDHNFALGQAVLQVLSWLPEEVGAGVHPIQVAISAHGWERPAGADDLLHLSKRTRLVIRVPRHRLEDGQALVGRVLDVRGQALMVTGSPTVRPLQPNPTLYSRNVALGADEEDDFLRAAAQLLERLDIVGRKMLCWPISPLRNPFACSSMAWVPAAISVAACLPRTRESRPSTGRRKIKPQPRGAAAFLPGVDRPVARRSACRFR